MVEKKKNKKNNNKKKGVISLQQNRYACRYLCTNQVGTVVTWNYVSPEKGDTPAAAAACQRPREKGGDRSLSVSSALAGSRGHRSGSRRSAWVRVRVPGAAPAQYRVRPWDAGCARCGIGDVSRACAKRAQQRRELRQGTVLSRFWVSGSIRVRQEADRQAGC